MSVLRAVKKLLFGETWLLGLGLAVLLVTLREAVRPALGSTWDHAGGFVLLAGVVVLLVTLVSRGARPG